MKIQDANLNVANTEKNKKHYVHICPTYVGQIIQLGIPGMQGYPRYSWFY